MDQADRHRIEKMQLLPPVPPRYHETRFLKHLEMLHYAKARHLEFRLEFPERLSVPLVKPVEQKAPRFVAEGPKHEILFAHRRTIGDLMVTCRGLFAIGVRMEPDGDRQPAARRGLKG